MTSEQCPRNVDGVVEQLELKMILEASPIQKKIALVRKMKVSQDLRHGCCFHC
ncbi:hypothetical protein BHE74_00035738 [Ensete ventricosum]|nr:hypothetical protein GW17_00027245 [Ensete ventricosum]RWW57475.1 hypothetical protein BHE74_00035738 [Ensete ventricosum]RZS01876.1 hypothetical protein BHM03_00031817 [Ensete ventricosum]